MDPPARVLVIHLESVYFAGAETMLGHYLAGLLEGGEEVVVAFSQGSRTESVLPAGVRRFAVVANQPFSLRRVWQQGREIQRQARAGRFQLVHGWAARDWEMTAWAAWRAGLPSIGTLHDHPTASFITRPRQRLMRWCGRFGLDRVVCVSEAVRGACQQAGYPEARLSVIHNGLELPAPGPDRTARSTFRLGFLGAFSERKGLQLLLQWAAGLAGLSLPDWELHLAGAPQGDAGQLYWSRLRGTWAAAPWWSRVVEHGWVANPREFLRSVDLLVCPSVDFDPFPTVLLEAASQGVPAAATPVGGIPEIVLPDQTGWLLDPADSAGSVRTLARLVSQPEVVWRAGQLARARLAAGFTLRKMVADYQALYRSLGPDE